MLGYCSYLLARRGLAPTIKNLVGKLEFTDEELRATQLGLDRSGVAMPAFEKIGASLRRELNEPDLEADYEDEKVNECVAYDEERWDNDLDEIQSVEAEESEEEEVEEEEAVEQELTEEESKCLQ